MRVSWVWVAMAAIYFVSAWIVATTLIGVFLAGLNLSLASVLFVAPFLLIPPLCLLGFLDIANRFNEAFGSRKTQRQVGSFQMRISWRWVAIIAIYGSLAWITARTAVGEFLVSLVFSLVGMIFLLCVLLILTLSLICNIRNRREAEIGLKSVAVAKRGKANWP